MRRLGLVLILLAALLIAGWLALLRLPDAPRRTASTAPVAKAAPPTAGAGWRTPAGLLAVPVAGVARAAIADSWAIRARMACASITAPTFPLQPGLW